MEFILLDFFIVYPLLGYLIIFLGMFVEGDLVLFAAAFLARLGVFGIFPLVATSFFGMLAGDAFWYFAGRHHEKLPKFLVRLFERAASPFDRVLSNHPFRTLLIGKFTYGVHRLLLARAGSERIPFSRFFKNNLAATVIWIATLVSLGYFGGFAIDLLREYYRFAEIGLLIGIVIVILVEKALRRYSISLSQKNGKSADYERVNLNQ